VELITSQLRAANAALREGRLNTSHPRNRLLLVWMFCIHTTILVVDFVVCFRQSR
jgi:hypothetical protein